MRRLLLALIAIVAFAVGCSESPDQAQPIDTDDELAAACEDLELIECARLSTIADLVPAEPVQASGEPIVVGMVNQENTPVGSFPELSLSVQAAVDFVNDQLGGVGGRPVRVEVCNTGFSAEGSTACGQRFAEQQVAAVLGGIDIFGNAVDVLESNRIPYVGGIPVSGQSVTAANSYQWSGGTWGAAVAFAEYADTALGAESVAIVFGDFGSISDSADYGRTVLESRGIATTMVPYPIVTADLTSALSAAVSSNPEALFVLAADTGCKAAFDGVQTLGIEVPVFYVGACASPNIVASVPAAATEGAYFNVEGPVSTVDPEPDFALYSRVLDAYSNGLDEVGAATVSFRSFMNLWVQLAQIDGTINAESVTARLAAQVNTGSFMGHPYTCDRQQFAGLPAICSPQQILVQLRDGEVTQITDWIDVGAIYAAAR